MTKKTTTTQTFTLLGDGTIQAKTGDKMEMGLRKERADASPDSLEPAVTLLGANLSWGSGRIRAKGLACKGCGRSEDRVTGAATIVVSAGHYPHRPSRFVCEACGHGVGTVSQLIDAYEPQWRAQLKILRQIGASTPVAEQWVIAEDQGRRVLRPSARAAIDAALGPDTGNTIKLVKVVAFREQQALDLLHDPDLPLRETRIDRLGRPLERWNTVPKPEEVTELRIALTDYRNEVERAIDAELRQIRAAKLAEAGL
jgi:hypothetical protein